VFARIRNEPMDYAWGRGDGVSRVLGTPGSGRPEAELWLGAHPSSPARRVDAGSGEWTDLLGWETARGQQLPYLMKVLCAAAPLSIQAHPTPAQARAGFEREEALGIPRSAPDRNYKDANAKPELIVALEDGFEALCGFRSIGATRTVLDAFETAGVAPARLAPLRRSLDGGVREAFRWALGGGGEVADLMVALIGVAGAEVAKTEVAQADERLELVARLAAAYPADPGILVALLMNHVVLAAGEAIWMPAGNVHAYLRGDGIELMGPSDNVLRGGLTPKHIDIVELERVLDFTTGPPPLLAAVPVAPGVVSYRPRSLESGRDVSFELLAVTDPAELELPGASIAIATDGAFELYGGGAREDVPRGTAVFIERAAAVRITGRGRLFIATCDPGVH
jgi:mannose-6-phosphate isomerase